MCAAFGRYEMRRNTAPKLQHRIAVAQVKQAEKETASRQGMSPYPFTHQRRPWEKRNEIGWLKNPHLAARTTGAPPKHQAEWSPS